MKFGFSSLKHHAITAAISRVLPVANVAQGLYAVGQFAAPVVKAAAVEGFDRGVSAVERGWKSMFPKVHIPDYPEAKPTPNLAQQPAAYSFAAFYGKKGRGNKFITHTQQGGGRVAKPLLHGGM